MIRAGMLLLNWTALVVGVIGVIAVGIRTSRVIIREVQRRV